MNKHYTYTKFINKKILSHLADRTGFFIFYNVEVIIFSLNNIDTNHNYMPEPEEAVLRS